MVVFEPDPVPEPTTGLRIPLVASNDVPMSEFEDMDHIQRFIDRVPFVDDNVEQVEADEVLEKLISVDFVRSRKSLHVLDALNFEGLRLPVDQRELNCDGSRAVEKLMEPEYEKIIDDVISPRRLTVRFYKFVSSPKF